MNLLYYMKISTVSVIGLILLFLWKKASEDPEGFVNRFMDRPQASPPTRNMSYDMRCEPEIKKNNDFPFSGSSLTYVPRERCLSLQRNQLF